VLSGVVGQERARAILTNAVARNRIAGSYLFLGPDGVGKTTTALLFAALLCGATSPSDPIVRRIREGTHPDVRVVQPTGRSHSIHIGQLWPRAAGGDHPAFDAMLRDIQYEPLSGPRRVFIIRDAEGLSRGGENAANSILKTLEEPPSYAHFILTATSAPVLLPTIVSRCQVVPFSALPPGAVARLLVEQHGIPAEQAGFLAAYAEGRPGVALRLARSRDVLLARDQVLDIAETLSRSRPIQAFKLSDAFRKVAPGIRGASDGVEAGSDDRGNREPLRAALEIVASFYRDMAAVCSLSGAGPTPALINVDRRETIVRCATGYHWRSLQQAVDRIAGTRLAIERNAYGQTAIDVLFVELGALAEGRSLQV
jgi:DNA polymerase-3 subunit delta'